MEEPVVLRDGADGRSMWGLKTAPVSGAGPSSMRLLLTRLCLEGPSPSPCSSGLGAVDRPCSRSASR